LIGRVIGEKYTLLRRIKAGGFGAVYFALQADVDAYRAVKVLKEDHAGDPRAIERFEQEARILGKLSTKRLDIVGVVDRGEFDGERRYMVLEFVEGEPLSKVLRREKRLPVMRALRIAKQLAVVLAELETEKMVHRDLKPGNIMIRPPLGDEERICLLDFGVAWIERDDPLTQVGGGLGTYRYMALEQWEPCEERDGRLVRIEPDSRADVYSLGVLLFEMLAGCPPYKGLGDDPFTILHQMKMTPPKRVTELRPDVPGAVADCVEEMLATDRSVRPWPRALVPKLRSLLASIEDEPVPVEVAVEKTLKIALDEEGSVTASITSGQVEGVRARTLTPDAELAERTSIRPLPRRAVILGLASVGLLVIAGVALTAMDGLVPRRRVVVEDPVPEDRKTPAAQAVPEVIVPPQDESEPPAPSVEDETPKPEPAAEIAPPKRGTSEEKTKPGRETSKNKRTPASEVQRVTVQIVPFSPTRPTAQIRTTAVWVDGARVGSNVDEPLSLTPGVHEVMLETSLGRVEKVVTVKSGEPRVRINVDSGK
jgi:serine/threonine-protein kinase